MTVPVFPFSSADISDPNVVRAVNDMHTRLVALEAGSPAVGPGSGIYPVRTTTVDDPDFARTVNDLNARLVSVEGSGADPGPSITYGSAYANSADTDNPDVILAFTNLSARILAADPIKHV